MEKTGDPQTTGHSPLTVPWLAALHQAWTAYVQGSYAIGAVIVDRQGEVIARGRNRLHEPRRAEGGVIGGHDLAHAEINALLDLTGTPRPDVYGWTVLTTVQPCPQCAGAIAMSGIRAVAYAAPDPWAGCTRLLTDDPYVSRKGIRVERASDMVQRAALRLALAGFMREGHDQLGPFLTHFHEYAQDVAFAHRLHGEGTLAALREREAPLEEVLAALLGEPVNLEGASWPVERDVLDLPDRVQAALAKAGRLGFEHSCSLETGRVLRTLAATRPGGRFAELGTGAGVGAAWLLSGMDHPAHLVTVEWDAERASVARGVLAGDGRVTVLTGDWTQALASGPFDLIFNDCAPAKREAGRLDRLVQALNPGGLLVLDNFSPPDRLPERFRAGDPEREALWDHPALVCSELAVSEVERVILAVRKG